jgi:hypothetical protein
MRAVIPVAFIDRTTASLLPEEKWMATVWAEIFSRFTIPLTDRANITTEFTADL